MHGTEQSGTFTCAKLEWNIPDCSRHLNVLFTTFSGVKTSCHFLTNKLQILYNARTFLVTSMVPALKAAHFYWILEIFDTIKGTYLSF